MTDTAQDIAGKGGAASGRARVRACLECGGEHVKAAEFCSAACRHTFTNRRKNRGAVLLDLYMAHRFQREVGARLKLLSRINRLVSIYREEDRRERAGRRSWRHPQDVIAERPVLRSVQTKIRSGR